MRLTRIPIGTALGGARARGLGREPLHPLFQPPSARPLQQGSELGLVGLADAAHTDTLAATVDCSYANSGNQHARQEEAWRSVLSSLDRLSARGRSGQPTARRLGPRCEPGNQAFAESHRSPASAARTRPRRLIQAAL